MRVVYGVERGSTYYGKSRSDEMESNQQEEVAQARLSHRLLVGVGHCRRGSSLGGYVYVTFSTCVCNQGQGLFHPPTTGAGGAAVVLTRRGVRVLKEDHCSINPG